jgi:hypothetical protein
MITRIFTYICLIFSVLGCAGQKTYTLPTQNNLVEQERILKQIYLGQPKYEVLSLLNSNDSLFMLNDRFEVLDRNKLFSFINFSNYKSSVNFGFYFEDELLVSLSVNDIFKNKINSCRSILKTKIHWLNYGIQPYANWIKSQNMLGENFNYKVHHSSQRVEGKSASMYIEEALTIAIYSPFIIIGLPFYFVGEFFEEPKKDKKFYTDRAKAAESIKIGTLETEVLNKLGPADMIDFVQDSKVLTYRLPSISFAFDGGNVVWIESLSIFEWFSRQRESGKEYFEKIDCGSLEMLWEK